MKSVLKAVAALAVLCLAFSGAAWASQGKTGTTAAKPTAKTTATSAKTMSMSGTVVSSTANSLVVSHKAKGKDEQMTFSMDATTQKEGTIADGAAVTVKYHTENGTHMATWVKAAAPKATKTTASKSSKSAKSGKSSS
jgi:hypothetical protein